MRLGDRQIEALTSVGNPTMTWLCGSSKIMQTLRQKGCVRPLNPKEPDACLAITPAGLRALAEALEAGRIEQKLPEHKAVR